MERVERVAGQGTSWAAWVACGPSMHPIYMFGAHVTTGEDAFESERGLRHSIWVLDPREAKSYR